MEINSLFNRIISVLSRICESRGRGELGHRAHSRTFNDLML